MEDVEPTAPLVIRLATPEDIEAVVHLDSFSTSPTRHIHRDMQKYFGSVDPSTHEQTLIFLAEIDGIPAGKAELMLPPVDASGAIGYIKRVVVHPHYRGRALARHLMTHILHCARTEYQLDAIDLHVWEGNAPAIKLYESLGFQLQHIERYYHLPL